VEGEILIVYSKWTATSYIAASLQKITFRLRVSC